MAANVKMDLAARLDDHLHELKGVMDICRNRVAGSRIFHVYTYEDDFAYVYRRIAYFTSCWENVYITGVSIGNNIVVCVDEEVES